jgi:hypothetical protein
LQDELKCNETKAQIAALYHGMINTVGINFSDCIKPLHVGLDDGLQAGDVMHAMVCALLISCFSFYSGMELTQVSGTLDRCIRLMRDHNVPAMLWVTLMYKQVVSKLTERLRLPRGELKLKRSEYFIRRPPNSKPIQNEHGWVAQALQAYMYDDYKLVWEASEQFHKSAKKAQVSTLLCIPIILVLLSHVLFSFQRFPLLLTLVAFCRGMAALALTQVGTSKIKKSSLREVIKSSMKQVKKLSKKSPINLGAFKDLIEAEHATICRKNYVSAEESFSLAIENASKVGRTYVEALAYERYGNHHLIRGNQGLASEKLKMSHTLYAKWGARLKCELMERKFADLLD